jgi:phytoene/squalene synthetase
LQLANFWQDVAIDLANDRVYFPRRDLDSFNLVSEDLRSQHLTPKFIALMEHEIAFARDLLVRGADLCLLVDRQLRREILMFVGGGLAILRAIEKINYDVFRRRPKLGKLDYLALGWDAIRGRVSH